MSLLTELVISPKRKSTNMPRRWRFDLPPGGVHLPPNGIHLPVRGIGMSFSASLSRRGAFICRFRQLDVIFGIHLPIRGVWMLFSAFISRRRAFICRFRDMDVVFGIFIAADGHWLPKRGHAALKGRFLTRLATPGRQPTGFKRLFSSHLRRRRGGGSWACGVWRSGRSWCPL